MANLNGPSASRAAWVTVRIGVTTALLVVVLAGAGVVEAGGHHANEQAPCPYENGNQGAEHADEKGLEKSSPGIETAAGQICDGTGGG